MTANTHQVIIDDNITAELKRIGKAGGDLTPAMAAISGKLLTSAKLNFEGEHDPLGVPWAKVKNPPDFGTILRRSGDLFKSLKNAFGPLFALAGPENSGGAAIYAARHQFGGSFPWAGRKNQAVPTKKTVQGRSKKQGPPKPITTPARAYVGWNQQLRDDTLDILSRHLQGIGKRREGA